MRIINPNSKKKVLWNILISVSVLLSVIITPVVLVLNIKHNFTLLLFDICVGILYIIDIYINFKTAYYDGKELITDPVLIRNKYLKSWFTFDLIASLPFFLLPGIYISLNRVVRFIRLVRVLKVFTLFQTINNVRKTKISSNVIRLLIMGFWLLLTAHLIACGFIFVGGIDANISSFMKYLQALYWTITTLATVGYGDFIPDKNNPVQLIYVIFAQVSGVGMYGYVIGNITNVISNIDISKTIYMEKMEKIYTFLKYRKISDRVAKKINNYYTYLWESRRGHEESDILRGLPKNIKLMVAQEIHADILSKVPFFRDASESFIQDITLCLEPVVFTPGDIIIQKDDPGYEVFFINSGAVDVMGDDGTTIVATIYEGGFFGELALLFSSPRKATIIARDYCDIYILNKDNFDKILLKYPDFAQKISLIANERKSDHEIHSNNQKY